MKKRKIIKIGLWVFFIPLIIFLLLLYLMRPYTPSIKTKNGIASLEKISLNNVDQWISIRGDDMSNPILLFLHGGPGMPMMYLSYKFQRPLEKDFICVQWDQRGAGKSFDDDIPVDTMNIEQLLDDAVDLIQHLKNRFDQNKIFLAGHSFGSYLGMILIYRRPELFFAYLGIGQVVDERRASNIQTEFIRETAEKKGFPEAIEELKKHGKSVHEKWLFKFHAELYSSTDYTPFIKSGVFSPEYGFFDIFKVSKGSNFSSRHMKYNAIDKPLVESIQSVRVPVYFFIGRHDYVTPSELVEEYFDVLEAPSKKIVWFEQSAHFPFFEEPDKFAETVKILLLRSY